MEDSPAKYTGTAINREEGRDRKTRRCVTLNTDNEPNDGRQGTEGGKHNWSVRREHQLPELDFRRLKRHNSSRLLPFQTGLVSFNAPERGHSCKTLSNSKHSTRHSHPVPRQWRRMRPSLRLQRVLAVVRFPPARVSYPNAVIRTHAVYPSLGSSGATPLLLAKYR